MKIVVIHGQNHKGCTWNACNILLNGISCEKEIKEFFLPKDLNHFCLGCYACIQDKTKCPYWKEKSVLEDAMKEADLLVFTTPNYCMMPSGPLKSFLDLFFTNWFSHKPLEEMFSKRAVVISTCAGAGAKQACALVAENLENWGIPQIIKYGFAVNAFSFDAMSEKKKNKVTKDLTHLAKILSKNKKVHAGFKTRFLFWFYSGMQKANWGASPIEKQYWQEKGWLSGTKPWKTEK